MKNLFVALLVSSFFVLPTAGKAAENVPSPEMWEAARRSVKGKRPGRAFNIVVPPSPLGGYSVGYLQIPYSVPPGLTRSWSNLSFGGTFSIIQNRCFLLTGSGVCTMGIKYTPGPSPAMGSVQVYWIDTDGNNQQVATGFDVVNAVSEVSGPRKCKCTPKRKGSVIGVADQTLGESVSIVGTDFALTYFSENSPNYLGSKLDPSPAGGFNVGSWNPSIHHYYSPTSLILFKGSGAAISANHSHDPRGYLVVGETDAQEFFVFDGARHVETRDAISGKVIYTFQYDSTGLLSSITNAAGKSTAFNRDPAGLITSIVSPYGQTTTVTVNSAGLYSSFTSPGGKSHLFTYKPGTSLLETFTRPGGQVDAFTYDVDGRLTKDLGNGGNFSELLDIGTNSLKVLSALGLETSYVTSVSSTGKVSTSVSDPSGLVTVSSEGADGAYSNQSPIESFTSAVVQDFRVGAVYERTSSTTVSVGSVNRTTTISQSYSYPVNQSGADRSAFNHATLNRSETVVAAGGNRVRTLAYDAATGKIIETSPEGATVETIYNALNLPSSLKVGNDTPVTLTYDQNGNLAAVAQGTANNSTYAYNSAGLVGSVTDGLNRTWSYQYDADNRLTKTILPDSREVAYSYDANGNVASITPPSRPAHTFVQNAMELLQEYLPPALGGISNPATTYTYNLDKQVTKVLRPDGQEVNFTYDATKGLLTSVSAGTSSSRVYAYQTNMPLVSNVITTDGANSLKETFEYYGTNVKAVEQRRASDEYRYGRVSFGFDATHRRVSRTVEGHESSSASTINSTLNKDDEPTQIGAMTLSYSYPSGRLSGTTLDGISDAYTYDTLGNLATYTAIYTPSSGPAQVLYSYELTRNAMSQIVGKTETVRGSTTTYEYGYDTAGHLTSVKENGQVVGNFTYDDNGNRSGGTLYGQALTATYDAQDRITSLRSKTFTHNANGELTGEAGEGSTASIGYSALGQMTLVQKDGKSYGFAYDASGAVVRTTKNGSLQRHYLYENSLRIAAELSDAGAIVKEYVYGTAVNSPDYMIHAGERYRIIKDHLGSPRLVVKSTNGRVAQRLDYDVFGKILRDSNTCFQPFGFAGGIVHEDLKYVKFGLRSYEPSLGRWLSKDPIGFDGGDSNLYGYVLQDPVNLIDYNGENPFIVIGAAIGAFLASTPTDTPVTLGDEVANVLGGAATGAAVGGVCSAAATGAELTIAGMRFAPFGNRTGHKIGRFPHYHRRGIDQSGATKPGQSIGRHRPWEKKSTDKSIWDRF